MTRPGARRPPAAASAAWAARAASFFFFVDPGGRPRRAGTFGASMTARTVEKTLVKDLVPYLEAPGGLLYEKIEGMAVMDNGDVYVCNDNDGVDDNSGETQLLNVGGIL